MNKPRKKRKRFDEEFYLFWDGPFSQWTHADMEIDGVEYNCCEQYMMAQKARLFEDYYALADIMAVDDPREQKAIGRRVRDFDLDVWEEIEDEVILEGNFGLGFKTVLVDRPRCWNIVYKGNRAKYDQNGGLKSTLMNTEGTLVEASPYDKVWGIGRGMDDPDAHVRDRWLGSNWLGEVLTVLRDEYFKEEDHLIKHGDITPGISGLD